MDRSGSNYSEKFPFYNFQKLFIIKTLILLLMVVLKISVYWEIFR